MFLFYYYYEILQKHFVKLLFINFLWLIFLKQNLCLFHNTHRKYFHNMDSSPFDAISTYTVYIEPYLNTIYKEYQRILTIDKQPAGALAPLVRPINTKPLSPFYSPPQLADPFSCTYAIMRYPNAVASKSTNAFLTVKDIPTLIAFLKTNGYAVDMDVLKITDKCGGNIGFNDHTGGKKTMVCTFTYVMSPP